VTQNGTEQKVFESLHYGHMTKKGGGKKEALAFAIGLPQILNQRATKRVYSRLQIWKSGGGSLKGAILRVGAEPETKRPSEGRRMGTNNPESAKNRLHADISEKGGGI